MPDQAASATPKRHRWLSSLLLLVCGGIAVWSVRSSVCETYVIISSSMKPGFFRGDQLLVDKLAYGLRLPLLEAPLFSWSEPVRGELVIFRDPKHGWTAIKRVVGVAGDSIALRAGRLVLNGTAAPLETLGVAANWPGEGRVLPLGLLQVQRLRENLAGSWHTLQIAADTACFGPVAVAPGHVFLLGDNRDDSLDSRVFGALPLARLRGTPAGIYWSGDETGWQRPRLLNARACLRPALVLGLLLCALVLWLRRRRA